MTADDLFRERMHLEGEIGQDIYDDFWAKTSYRYGHPAVEYEPAGDVAEALAPDDPYFTVLRRKSDGQLFEIEIEVTARPIDAPPPGEHQEIPGQQDLLAEVTP